MNSESINITIPLIPVTKKNSQQIIMARGRPVVIPSAAYRRYEDACKAFLRPIPKDPVNGPVNVQCVYYMPTRRRVDLVNLQEATLDILVKFGFLEDDNSNIVASMDGSRVLYDKQRPRTEIEIREVIDR